MELDIYSKSGKPTGQKAKLSPEIFGIEPNVSVMHQVVTAQLAHRRAGTQSTKTRSEVSGGGKKPFGQKGTGNARVGNKRTNKRRGGGTAKGPKPRDYEYHLPRQAVKAATRMALLSKFQDQEAILVEDLNLSEIKTKGVQKILKALKLDNTTCLVGTAGINKNFYLSARNIPGVEVLPASDLNAYTILRQKRLILTKDALEELRKSKKN